MDIIALRLMPIITLELMRSAAYDRHWALHLLLNDDWEMHEWIIAMVYWMLPRIRYNAP